jgi:hypothetical protein
MCSRKACVSIISLNAAESKPNAQGLVLRLCGEAKNEWYKGYFDEVMFVITSIGNPSLQSLSGVECGWLDNSAA